MSIADLIAMGGGRIDVPDIAGAIAEGAQIGRSAGLQRLQAQEAEQQIKERTLANLATQREQGDIAAQREALAANTAYADQGPQLNRAGYLSQLAKYGATPLAYSEQARFQAADIAAKQAEIDKAQKEIERRSQMLGGVKNPMQLAAAIPEMERMGIDVSEIRALPFQRNWREVVDDLIDQGLSHKERLDLAKQALEEQKNTLAWNTADVEQQYKREGLGLEREKLELQRELGRGQLGVDWYRAQHPAAIMAGSVTKPPPGYRFTATGDLEAIPGGPADIKTQATAAQKAAGATDVASAISVLRDAYDRLEAGGGITSTKKGAIGNIFAAGSSSGAGQAIGRAIGSANQSARNDIAMTRPALLGALMKATGMSAKQMDSNAELKLWLATATDPTLDVESNRRALDAIERKYMAGVAGDGTVADAPTRVYQGVTYRQRPDGQWEKQ